MPKNSPVWLKKSKLRKGGLSGRLGLRQIVLCCHVQGIYVKPPVIDSHPFVRLPVFRIFTAHKDNEFKSLVKLRIHGTYYTLVYGTLFAKG